VLFGILVFEGVATNVNRDIKGAAPEKVLSVDISALLPQLLHQFGVAFACSYDEGRRPAIVATFQICSTSDEQLRHLAILLFDGLGEQRVPTLPAFAVDHSVFA